MAAVLNDLSAEARSRVCENNYFNAYTCFSVVPGVEVDTSHDMIRMVSPGIPGHVTNAVFRCRLSPDNVDSAIDETGEYYRGRGVTPQWRICHDDQPAGLNARLTEKGFILETEQTAMVVDLHSLNEDVRPPNGLRIEPIANARTMQEKNGWIRQFGPGKSNRSLVMDGWAAYGFGPDSPWQHYIGMLGGEAVAWASAFYDGYVVGIYTVGTVPEARRQGIGSAITLRALLDARERGYHTGTLQATQMGYGVYRSLGFETCFNIKMYAP